MGSHSADLVLLSPLVLCGRFGQNRSAVGKVHKFHKYDSFTQSAILCTARPQFSALHQHQRAQDVVQHAKIAECLSFGHKSQNFAEVCTKDTHKDDALGLL